MPKLMAILNVIAWSGFWAFGYLALSSDSTQTGQIMIAGLLAVAGAAAGIFAYMQLVRHSESSGYAKPRNRVPDHMRHEDSEEIL